jgi:hypothetical protein
MKRLAIILASGACALSAAPVAGATGGRVCGFVRASVPYSAHSSANRWRVYVAGASTCGSAQKVLSAVMHLQATAHPGSDEAHSFFSYGGWICPFGDMGSQRCSVPADSPSRPRAKALAVECSLNRCPSSRPPGYFAKLSLVRASNSIIESWKP